MNAPLLQTENLTKRFGEVTANDDITLDVVAGEIHCLFGENGAGKSTLSACLSGYYRPDSGRILYQGRPVDLRSPADAIRLGIGIVHQHFVLVPRFTVLENIIVGTQNDGIRLRTDAAEREIWKICDAYSIRLDLDAVVETLSVGEQQWVEILKALYLGARLLILDEPTAVLTPQQSERLFDLIREMRGKIRQRRHLSQRIENLGRERVEQERLEMRLPDLPKTEQIIIVAETDGRIV